MRLPSQKILIGLATLIVVFAVGGVAAAQMGGGISTAVPFVQSGTAIIPTVPSSTIGSPSNRIEAIYAKTADLTNVTIGGAVPGLLTAGGAFIDGSDASGNYASYPAVFRSNTPSSATTWNNCYGNDNATQATCINVHDDGSFGIYDVDPRNEFPLDSWLFFFSTSTDWATYGYDYPGIILGGINTSHTLPYFDDWYVFGSPKFRIKDQFMSGKTFYATSTGPVLKSPDGSCYMLTITNGGGFATSTVSPCGY